jgi:uncharacterized protein
VPSLPTRVRPAWRWLATLAAALPMLAAPVHAQQPVPPLEARVTDLTGTLSADARAALERKLEAFEAEKGSQIAVLLVATTAPESIEQYSLRVAEAWKLGRAGVDDGVLLLVAVQDRRARFEVGYGLEGAVPDALARRIIAETLAPRFAEGDYAGGLTAGLDALIGLIRGEPLPPAEPSASPDVEPWAALPVLLVFAAFLAPLFRRLFGTLFGSAALGAGAGVIVWLVSSVLFAALAVGAMVFVFALAGIGGRGGRWASRGPWGGFGGGLGGGFGSGGGGFRGGGGRFGGGGASGGW